MKRVLSLIMALLLIVALCGCQTAKECEHQWQSADCVNPESCSLCGQTRGEAPGHRWQEASCSAPETCSVCGETQGEALPHSFSEPEFKESAMSMVCSRCGYEESLSHEDYVQQLLLGEWGFFENISPEGVLSCELLESRGATGTRLYINEDGTGRLILGDHIKNESFELLGWEYLECGQAESGFYHVLRINAEELSQIIMLINSDEGTAIMLPLDSELTSYDILKKRPDMRGIVCGIWLDTSGGALSTVKLNEDFSAELIIDGKAARGTWYLGNVDDSDIERLATLTLSVTPGEKNYEYDCEMHLGRSAEPIETAAREAYFYCYALDKSFERVSGEEVEAINKAMELGRSLPAGQWYSTAVSRHEDGNTERRSCSDYSMTFSQDGSFTAELDGQYSGFWRLDDVRLNETNCAYRYVLAFEGYEQTATVEMWVDIPDSYGDSEFRMNVQGYTLEFAREQGEGIGLFEGSWLGCYRGEIAMLELYGDHSFSLDIQGGIEGVWTVSDSETDGSGNYVHYDLEFESSELQETLYANCSQYVGPGSDPTVTDALHLSGCIFERLGDRDAEAAKAGLQELMDAAPAKIAGTWRPSEGENARSYDGEDYSGYSVSFTEDGSFTADFEKQYKGSWQLESINESVVYLSLLMGDESSRGTLYLNFDELDIGWLRGNSYSQYEFIKG